MKDYDMLAENLTTSGIYLDTIKSTNKEILEKISLDSGFKSGAAIWYGGKILPSLINDTIIWKNDPESNMSSRYKVDFHLLHSAEKSGFITKEQFNAGVQTLCNRL